MSERLSDETLAEWREYSASGAQARMLALAYPPTEILAAIDELIELRAENEKLRDETATLRAAGDAALAVAGIMQTKDARLRAAITRVRHAYETTGRLDGWDDLCRLAEGEQ